MVPGWQTVFTKTYLSLADYWAGGLGVKAVSEGGQRTYAAATLGILSNSWDTSLRLFAGLALGMAVGLILRACRLLVEMDAPARCASG